MDLSDLSHHVVTLEQCGPVSVYIQGDLDKQRDGTVFLTVHDVGSSFTSWVNWVMDISMEEVRRRSVFIHIALPGQELGAVDRPGDWNFPSMKDLGLNLVTVLDNLRIQRVVGLGDGAGANIITRFGMCHPSRVLGVVTINNTATASLGRFMDRLREKMKSVKGDGQSLNEKNVSKFAEAYRKRTEIIPDLNKKINFDVLLIAGMKSKYVQDTEAIHKEMSAGLCSMIKIEDVSEPLTETPARVSETVLLFCQGIGLLPSAPRRFSGHGSTGSGGSLSDSRRISCSSAMSEKLYLDPSLQHHIVDLENCGPVSVFLQGDLEKHRDGVVFLTVHDVGSTYMSWKYFVTDTSMEDIRRRSLFIHVAIPGQEPGAPDLPEDFVFPKMQDLGLNLVSILDTLRIPRVVGIGDGAGANIITRFAMCHQSRVHGICTINNTATASLGRFMERIKEKMKAAKSDGRHSLNEKNLSTFSEAYRKRTEILEDLNKKINVDVLLIAGMKSKYVQDTEAIHKEMSAGLCSMIKIEDVSEPLTETPARVSEAILLFCQGNGLLSSAPRRYSKQESTISTGSNGNSGDSRKISTTSDMSEQILCDPSLPHHIINLEVCGAISIYIQGDLDKHREGVVFMTIHDVGDTYIRWKTFVDTSMQDIQQRSLFIHVAIPGQEPGAPELPQEFRFPKMKDLGLNLVSILDNLQIPRVIGLGDGAGANIITRFGMCHPSRVHGICTINNTATASLNRFMERIKEKMKSAKSDENLCMNEKNISKFADAYKKRTEILKDLNNKINFDVLLLAGVKSKYVKDTEDIHKEMSPGLCSMIKIEDVSEPLTETPGRVSEAVLLFCQGLGLLPSVNRKLSRQGSGTSGGSLEVVRNTPVPMDAKAA
eukprot:GFUD01012819.1.p1 GENE.GFUD01012819.1~~GFUD01012819.1.p1  ORF type:complete len:880 (+),score=232.59 GFUD01012819.1:62-2701(+)